MSWYSYRPYVSAAERRRKAAAAAKKMVKGGRALSPVEIEGRAIAKTFWGKAWCENLESYSDYGNRLPRGRTYARNGSVIDLQIAAGSVTALVQGSELYKIAITIEPLTTALWKRFRTAAAGKITNLLDLLQGRLGKEILADITSKGTGLFPAPKEIKLKCSCPDWAGMCKHLAAVLYGVGARLDSKPDLFFTLRGVDMQELITAASATATAPIAVAKAADTALAGADLSELFGVDIDSSGSTHPTGMETGKMPVLPAKPARAAKQPRGKSGDRSSTAPQKKQAPAALVAMQPPKRDSRRRAAPREPGGQSGR